MSTLEKVGLRSINAINWKPRSTDRFGTDNESVTFSYPAPARSEAPMKSVSSASFSAGFVRVGLSIGELGASWHLSRVIGPARAAEISFTGRTVKAEEAVRMGLANRIVPVEGEDVVTAAIELAETIAHNGAEGIRATKNSLIRNAEIDSFLSALELENRSQVVVKTTL